MELIIQKCVELGVERIVAVSTERAIVKLDKKEGKKLERWQKIAEAAAKQSGLPLDELFSEAVSVAAQRAVDLAEHNIKKVTLMSSMSSDIKNRLQKYIFEYNDFSRYEISELKVGYDGEKLMLKKICTPEFNDLLNEAM